MQEINIRAAEPPKQRHYGKWIRTLERFLASRLESAEVFIKGGISKHEATTARAALYTAAKRMGAEVTVQMYGTKAYLVRERK